MASGKLTLDDSVREVAAGDAIYIEKGQVHRVENDGEEFMVIIETQLGICVEDDIVRLEDDFGRVSP